MNTERYIKESLHSYHEVPVDLCYFPCNVLHKHYLSKMYVEKSNYPLIIHRIP